MDAQLKAKWVEALRSGKYRQTRGMLKAPLDNSFCCLGVLCDIQGADFDAIRAHYGTLSLSSSPYEYIGTVGVLSDRLAMMNDSGASFSEIADFIEKHL